MKVIFHIGTEKTGTSSIQTFLNKNRSVLKQHGYYFLWSTGEKNSRHLPAVCLRDDRPDDFLRTLLIDTLEKRKEYKQRVVGKLREEIKSLPAGIHTIIASSEHFHSRISFEDEVQNLKSLFMEFTDDFKIICYLREQVDTAISLFTTSLFYGGKPGLEHFVESICTEENDYFNYYRFIKKWEKVFLKDNISLRIFSRDDFVDGNLLEDFLCQIGAHDISDFDRNIPRENESLNHLGQCLARAVNRHVPYFIEGVGVNPFNRRLIEHISEKTRGKGICLSEKTYLQIQERFNECNELLRQEFFSSRSILFKSKKNFEKKENRLLSREQERLIDEVIGLLVKENTEKLAFHNTGWKALLRSLTKRHKL
ncbi:MAG: sulfotransferase domain-containing protein [Desulfobulbaceae bacterium]